MDVLDQIKAFGALLGGLGLMATFWIQGLSQEKKIRWMTFMSFLGMGILLGTGGVSWGGWRSLLPLLLLLQMFIWREREGGEEPGYSKASAAVVFDLVALSERTLAFLCACLALWEGGRGFLR